MKHITALVFGLFVFTALSSARAADVPDSVLSTGLTAIGPTAMRPFDERGPVLPSISTDFTDPYKTGKLCTSSDTGCRPVRNIETYRATHDITEAELCSEDVILVSVHRNMTRGAPVYHVEDWTQYIRANPDGMNKMSMVAAYYRSKVEQICRVGPKILVIEEFYEGVDLSARTLVIRGGYASALGSAARPTEIANSLEEVIAFSKQKLGELGPFELTSVCTQRDVVTLELTEGCPTHTASSSHFQWCDSDRNICWAVKRDLALVHTPYALRDRSMSSKDVGVHLFTLGGQQLPAIDPDFVKRVEKHLEKQRKALGRPKCQVPWKSTANWFDSFACFQRDALGGDNTYYGDAMCDTYVEVDC